VTHSSSNTVFHEAASGDSPLYVEEPDIPEGVTCAAWRRTRQRVAKRRLLADLPWLRWPQLRKALP
jgi:hypothetical protein